MFTAHKFMTRVSAVIIILSLVSIAINIGEILL